LWVVGILVGLILVTVIGLKVWVSTWPEYKGDRFSFRYPSGWFTSDYLTTYISGSKSLGGFQFSPQPRFLENGIGLQKTKVIDHSQVPIQVELDFYGKNDKAAISWFTNQSTRSLNVGGGKFIYLSLMEIRYLVLTENRVYVFGGSFNSLTRSSILSRPDIALETLLSMLSLKY